MKKLLFIPILLCAFATSGFAQSVIIPQVMAFQGYVATDTGAYSDTTGTTIVTVNLYDAVTGGNEVWSNTWDTIKVFRGYYSVVLDLSYPGHWIAGNLGFTKQYWLDVIILNKEELIPRVQLTSAAYSFRAQVADSARVADTANVADTALHVASSVPIGTIEAYGIDISKLPNDSTWLPCDGREIWAPAFPTFAALAGSTYGMAGTDSVYLPDLRGLFLRGVNGARSDVYEDSDASKRFSFHGGNDGNKVGSIQKDTLGSHSHSTSITIRDGADPLNDHDPFTGNQPAQGSNSATENGESYTSSSVGGNETRPKNAYVYWIIKVK